MDKSPMENAELGRRLYRLRRESGALAIVALRVDDVAYSVDPALSPRDFGERLEEEVPALVDHLASQRGRRE